MKSKLLIITLLLFVVISCVSHSTAPIAEGQLQKIPYSVEHGVLIELQIRTINKNTMEGHFLRAIALRGHDMSAMEMTHHEHNTVRKDQPVNLLDELVKHGCLFKAELYTNHQRLLVKKETALFTCNEKTYFVDGDLVDTHGVRGGPLLMTQGTHVYFKIK
jgi:hypothetical protein